MSFDVLSSGAGALAILDLDKVREATAYVQSLPEQDRSVVQTWLVFEALLRGLYYILVFTAVVLLGRRIIQAIIAGYREARSQTV